LADQRYPTPIAAELSDDVLDRFLRYVQVDTQSDDDSETYPSTAKQLDLGKMLADELREIGLEDVELTEHGYVFATVPGSAGPTVGLIAHMDTSSDESGTNVKPQVIRNYEGGDIVLPGDPRKVLRPSENPILAERAGHDIVTTDGTTLLGADDKAGVAEIMGAVAYLAAHPEIEHAPIRRRLHRRRGGGARRRSLRHRGVRRRLRVHAGRFGDRTHRRRDVLGLRGAHPDRRSQRPSRNVEGEDGQRDQARRPDRRAAAAGGALARDDGGT